jgi:hypothetical protein
VEFVYSFRLFGGSLERRERKASLEREKVIFIDD